MKEDSRINYVELPAEDFTKAKAFYGDVFGWTFQDYGDCYCAFPMPRENATTGSAV